MAHPPAARSTWCWCRRRPRCAASRRRASWPATPSTSRPKQKLDEAALKAQLTLAGYSHVSQVVSPGEYAVRGGLIDLFPMGSRGALPRRPVRRRDRLDPHLRPRHASAASTRCPRCACCPAASSRWTRRRARALPRALARALEGDPTKAASTRTSATASPPPASSTTCRCSSTRPRRSSTTSAPRRRWCCTARSTPRSSASGPTPASATASCSTTRSGRCCRPRRCSSSPRSSSRALQRACAARRCAAPTPRAMPGPGRCPTSASTAAPPEPLRRLQDHIAATPHRVLIVAESDGRRESLLELLRDSRHRAAGVAIAGRVRGRRRDASRSPSRRWPQGFAWHAPKRTRRDRVRHRDRAVRDRARRAPAAHARSRSATSTR